MIQKTGSPQLHTKMFSYIILAQTCLRTHKPGFPSHCPKSKPMNQEEILSQFEAWNSALQTGEPGNVAALYASDGILLPTLSNKVRHNHEEIKDYFVHFLAKGPVGKIDEANVRLFGEIAINSGVYTFTFKDGSAAQARFTFVYRKDGDRWMITEHHSSQMPE